MGGSVVLTMLMLFDCQASKTRKSHERDSATTDWGVLINSVLLSQQLINSISFECFASS